MKNILKFAQMQPSCSLVMPGNNYVRPPAGQSFSFLPEEQDSRGLGTALPGGGNFSLQQTGHSVSASLMHTRASSGTSADIKEEVKTQRKDRNQFWGTIHCHPKAVVIHGISSIANGSRNKRSDLLSCPTFPPFCSSASHPRNTILFHLQFQKAIG